MLVLKIDLAYRVVSNENPSDQRKTRLGAKCYRYLQLSILPKIPFASFSGQEVI